MDKAQEKIERQIDQLIHMGASGKEILAVLDRLGYHKLPREHRRCPKCSSIWVCWNWVQSSTKEWIHECWDCGNCIETTDKVEGGLPYDFLRTQYRPLLPKDKPPLKQMSP